MTQAGVNLALSNGDGDVDRKRKRTNEDDDDSSVNEDPSWQPSEGGGGGGHKHKKQQKRRNRRRSHKEQHGAAPPLDDDGALVAPAHETAFSRVTSTSVRVELTEDCDIAWEDFRPLGAEMIICKEGRFGNVTNASSFLTTQSTSVYFTILPLLLPSYINSDFIF